MTYEQFWLADPWLCVPYREKHKLYIEQRNEELWLQGLYIHNAFAVALNNAFNKSKKKYVTKPIEIIEPTEEEKQERIKQTRKKLVERLNALKDEFDKKQRTQN